MNPRILALLLAASPVLTACGQAAGCTATGAICSTVTPTEYAAPAPAPTDAEPPTPLPSPEPPTATPPPPTAVPSVTVAVPKPVASATRLASSVAPKPQPKPQAPGPSAGAAPAAGNRPGPPAPAIAAPAPATATPALPAPDQPTAIPTPAATLAPLPNPGGTVSLPGPGGSIGNGLGHWFPTKASLPADHVYQAATELPSGRILIAGGIGVASAEVYDPGSDSWASAGNLHAARQRAVATVLSSGLVLLSGGLANDESATNFPLPAEVFHPDSGQWTLTNPMHGGRINHQATLLPSGKVLVTGGDDQQNALASTEIFDPRTQAWTPAASMLHARSGHVAALIGGQVFVAGGTDGGAVLNSAELYDPVSNGWSPLPAMPTARGFSSLVTLPDSSLLVLGGEVGMNPVPHVEQYSPGRGWTPWPSMIDARMSPGVALVGGRWVIAAGDTPKHLHGAEYMDLQTRAWQAEPDYAPFHTHATLVATTTGLLVLGGPFNGTERLQFDPPKP